MIGIGKEAKVRYYDGYFEIVDSGQYVLCAVTGQRIELDRLKYWSVPRQEAYIDNQTALARNFANE